MGIFIKNKFVENIIIYFRKKVNFVNVNYKKSKLFINLKNGKMEEFIFLHKIYGKVILDVFLKEIKDFNNFIKKMKNNQQIFI